MSTPGRGSQTVVAALVAVAALLMAGCGASAPEATSAIEAPTTTSTTAGDASTTTTVPGELVEITVAGGQVSGGPANVEVAIGEAVTVRVTADVVEEVHVHGYDLVADLAPGVASEISFVADIPGVFEIELEESGLKVADLQVG